VAKTYFENSNLLPLYYRISRALDFTRVGLLPFFYGIKFNDKER